MAEKVADRIIALMDLHRKEILTTREASGYLGISESRIRHLCSKGLIPYHSNETRSRNYFKRSELDRWRASTKGYTKKIRKPNQNQSIMRKKACNQNGIWTIDTRSLALTWIGELPVPRPTMRERIGFAMLYLTSRGKRPTFIDLMNRLAKAVAFCMKAPQVSWSGKPMVTTGLSIEEEWANFNSNRCVPPHSGHGSIDSFDDRSSSLV